MNRLSSRIGIAFWCTLLAVLPSACGRAKEPLSVYCAAGIKDPVDAAARKYETETGVSVRLQYGPSQALLLQAEVSKKGDLYLPGDDSYIEIRASTEVRS